LELAAFGPDSENLLNSRLSDILDRREAKADLSVDNNKTEIALVDVGGKDLSLTRP
jgi:hypothetical protein